MTKIELDTEKLNKLDRSKVYIFMVEVGDRNIEDTLRIAETIKNHLKENYGFTNTYFIPTINGKSDVSIVSVDDCISHKLDYSEIERLDEKIEEINKRLDKIEENLK